jgi:hypothetical protein
MNFGRAHSDGDNRWIMDLRLERDYIHSPEDLILYKLIYFGLNQQSKHSRDIAAILKSKKSELDLNYIEGWVTHLGLTSVWKEMLDNIS